MKLFYTVLLLTLSLSLAAQNTTAVNKNTSAPLNTALKLELEKIHDSDQNIRTAYRAAQKEYGFDNAQVYNLGLEMNKIDSINTNKVLKILDTNGWVGKTSVGSKANEALFLVIQHANIQIQNKYLPLLRDAAEKGEASLSSLALLEDRIALKEGRSQIYGSQIGTHPTTKEFYVLPLHDPDNVDSRRAKMKLGPIKDYVANWEIVWDVDSYKKHLPEYEMILKEKNTK